nr:cation:dicarboxylase symporter family transporter [uncultured Sphingomonas sp.]
MSSTTIPTKAKRSSRSWPVLLALIAGLLLGALSGGLGDGWREPLVRIANSVGGLWLDALKMTVVPLIIALLVTGITSGADAARAGGIAGRSFIWFVGILTGSAIVGGLLTPALIAAFPLPDSAAEALRAGLATIDRGSAVASIPKLEDFLGSLIPTNPIGAAATDKILPLVVFTALFAFALTRIDAESRAIISRFFKAVEKAMLVMIGWVLALAPYGVFALGFAVGAGAGGSAFAALAHYILILLIVGGTVTLLGYLVAAYAGWSVSDFFRAMIQPQAVALSTQSSLACLPAMLTSAKALGVPERNADVTLPLAVALFRATGPAMNIAVAIYVAYWTGTPLPPTALIAGIAVASVASYWAVSLPGALSFITSIAPIALVMGVPIEPLAILIAVEVVPDMMRTIGNVVHDVAVTGAVAKRTRD